MTIPTKPEIPRARIQHVDWDLDFGYTHSEPFNYLERDAWAQHMQKCVRVGSSQYFGVSERADLTGDGSSCCRWLCVSDGPFNNA